MKSTNINKTISSSVSEIGQFNGKRYVPSPTRRRMLRIYTLLYLYGAFFAFSEGQRNNMSAVEEVIGMRERVVEEIAAKAEQLYNERQQIVEKCSCSRHDCATDFGENNMMECTSELLFETCEEDCGERLVNYNKTVVRTPDATNPRVLSGNMKQSICTYAGLEEEFKNVKFKHGLTNSWTYIGLQDGHFRTWPMRARGRDASIEHPYLDKCKPYDPRRRPWYSAASTGPKDVILLADRSVSMLASSGHAGVGNSLWGSAQRALLSLMDTFISADFLNVVLYSSDAQALWTDTALAEANPENRKKLKMQIRGAMPSGSTNIVAGFEKAIDLFIQGAKEGTSSNCSRIIILLSEGSDTRLRSSEVLATIEDLQKKLESRVKMRASVFSYSIGPEADESLAQLIACANQGLWAPVRRYEDPLSDMNNYLEGIAASRAKHGPVWVDPYEDAGGLGKVTTVSKPVFSQVNDGDMPHLLGVVGHDVRLNDLVVGGFNATEILHFLVMRSRVCTKLQLSVCDLQVWRLFQYPHAVCPDMYPKHTCYQFGDRWYRRFDQRMSQHHAKVFCEEMNGSLSPIRSPDHLRFLSAIASADKSWIGGQRQLGVDPIRFSFDDPAIPAIDQYHEGWASKHPGDSREICMTIDHRSISQNLESGNCEDYFDFICEFTMSTAAVCGEDSLEVTDPKGKLKTFEMPDPIDCPQIERAMIDHRPVDAAQDLASSDVICDFGPPVYHEDLYCCVDCQLHNNSHGDVSSSTSMKPSSYLYHLFFLSGLSLWLFIL